MEPFCNAKVADDPGKVDFRETGGLGVVKVVHAVPDRLQDAVICVSTCKAHVRLSTHEAKGVTPIPAPTSRTVSYLKKSSEALPNGPSTMTRGRTRLIGGFVAVPITLPPAASASSFLSLESKSQPTALARAVVKSPTTRIWTEM